VSDLFPVAIDIIDFAALCCAVLCCAVACCALLLLLQDTTGAKAFKRVNDEEWLGKKGSWSNTYEDTFGQK
jgi:hypothetical protein